MNTTAGELAAYLFFIVMLGIAAGFAYEAYSKAEGTNARTLLQWSSIIALVSFGGLIVMTGLYIIFSEQKHRKSFGRMAAHVFALLSMGAALSVGVMCTFAAIRLSENRDTRDKKHAFAFAITAASLTLFSLLVYAIWSIYSISRDNARARMMNAELARQQQIMRQSAVRSGQNMQSRRVGVISPRMNTSPNFERI